MDKTEDTVRLIKEGYTEPEIRHMLGYKSGGRVYQIAKNYGLTITKPTEKKAKVVAEYRRQGYTIDYIAKEMGMTHCGVNSIIKRYAIPFTPIECECVCEQCGSKYKRIRTNQKYCSTSCQAKATRERAKGKLCSDETAKEMLARHNADWEYVGDYTGSDGYMTIRHSCGYVTRKSSVTVRQNKVRCEACEERARIEREKQRERQKAIEKEVAEFFKPVKKIEQTKMKRCPVCGCLFIGGIKYCSSECSEGAKKHYQNMKKRRRAKQAWTDESKTITLEKLYERDGGTCWLCGKQCDYSAETNDNNYPSIDHVIPIAHGGKDEWKNIRLAHRGCNTLKGAKIVEGEAVSISPWS